ncbi:hypothetical protein Fmac_018724 [Flemingia macrophylla]|uniref:CTP synthase (glutamine hydrolyzing) n=1 Tax=Flemingia macrophylla TaxID=520843 RepID=A0ABD1M6G9_9FABA
MKRGSHAIMHYTMQRSSHVVLYGFYTAILCWTLHGRAVLQGNDQNEIEICVESGYPAAEEFDGTYLVFVTDGSDPYEVITIFVKTVEKHLQTFALFDNGIICCMSHNTDRLYSVATETNLKEWTTRTKVYDRCHEPALLHASVARNRKLIMDWVLARDLENVTYKEVIIDRSVDPEAYKAAWSLLKGANGVLVPGGFGDRGVQGKILATKYAREHN